MGNFSPKKLEKYYSLQFTPREKKKFKKSQIFWSKKPQNLSPLKKKKKKKKKKKTILIRAIFL